MCHEVGHQATRQPRKEVQEAENGPDVGCSGWIELEFGLVDLAYDVVDGKLDSERAGICSDQDEDGRVGEHFKETDDRFQWRLVPPNVLN